MRRNWPLDTLTWMVWPLLTMEGATRPYENSSAGNCAAWALRMSMGDWARPWAQDSYEGSISAQCATPWGPRYSQCGVAAWTARDAVAHRMKDKEASERESFMGIGAFG